MSFAEMQRTCRADITAAPLIAIEQHRARRAEAGFEDLPSRPSTGMQLFSAALRARVAAAGEIVPNVPGNYK